MMILGAVITVLLIAVFAVVYLNTSANLHSGLAQSLKTFQFYSISIANETVIPPSIDLNISFFIRNLADFAITVDSVNVLMYINNETIGTVAPVGKGLTFVVPPGENVTPYSLLRITKSEILDDLKNPPYLFRANGTISAYAQFLFVTESNSRVISVSQIVQT
jgi:hypothetical protein